MAGAAVIDDLIFRNEISMKMERVRSNPILHDEAFDDGVNHFRFRLCKPGKEVDVFLSLDPAEMDESPTLSDVLSMLAMDASGCQLLEGYEDRSAELVSVLGGSDGNLEEIENFWKEFHQRSKQSERVRRFLGESVYEELLDHFAL